MEKIYKYTEHVYILPFDRDTDRPNLGYIYSGGKAVMFDAGCGPKTARLLFSELGENNLPSPERIAISHWHWDHCFASGYIPGEYITNRYTRDKIREVARMKISSTDDYIDDENLLPEFCREHLKMEYPDISKINIKVPETVICDGYTIECGDVHLDLYEVTSPHCEGQVVGLVREDRVLFMGDAFSACIIGMDFIDDKPKRRLLYEKLKTLDFDYVVLSHFEPMTREEFWNQAQSML